MAMKRKKAAPMKKKAAPKKKVAPKRKAAPKKKKKTAKRKRWYLPLFKSDYQCQSALVVFFLSHFEYSKSIV